MKDRENTFRAWAQGPGRTEEQKCENAIRAIRDAISTDEKFRDRGVNVFSTGVISKIV